MRKEEFGIGIIDLDASYTVANLPTAKGRKGALVYVSNGSTGSPCIAVSDGTNWKVLAAVTATTVSAT